MLTGNHADNQTYETFLYPQNDVLLTVQIQNVMPQPVFLDVVSFDAAAGFTATDLNTTQGKETKYDEYMCMHTHCTWTVLG